MTCNVKQAIQTSTMFVHPGRLCVPVLVVIVDYCLFLTYWTGVGGWDRTTTGEYWLTL